MFFGKYNNFFQVGVLDGVPVTKKSTRFRLRKKKSGGGSWGGTIAGWGIDMNQSTSQSTNKTSVDVTDSSNFVIRIVILISILNSNFLL